MSRASRQRRTPRPNSEPAPGRPLPFTPRVTVADTPAAPARVSTAAWRALALATLAFTICFSVWGILSPLAPFFREQYALSGAQVGLLVAVPVVLGSLARIPLGLLTDRFGGRMVFTAMLIFLVVPLVLAGLTSSFGTLLGAAFLLGIGGAAFAI